ncbi:MAG: hypothetical protein ACLQVL_27870 [Terriglobia bacterium]
MRIGRCIALVMGIGFGLMAWPHSVAAQACKDETSMVDESKKALADAVSTVKQESLSDFEKAYHQKSVVNKLGFFGVTVDSLLTCLEKDAQDQSASKEVVDAAKAQHEIYVKLKDKIQHDHNTLKALAAPKQAKEYVEKLDEAT